MRDQALILFCFAHRYAKAMRATYESDYALVRSNLGTANHIVVNAEMLEHGNMSTKLLELRRIVNFVLEDGSSVSSNELLIALMASDGFGHTTPFKDELTFEEAFTKTLRIRFWRLLGNETAALGNYYPPEWIF